MLFVNSYDELIRVVDYLCNVSMKLRFTYQGLSQSFMLLRLLTAFDYLIQIRWIWSEAYNEFPKGWVVSRWHVIGRHVRSEIREDEYHCKCVGL